MIEVLAEEAMRSAKKASIDAIEIFLQRKVLKRLVINKGIINNIIEQERSGYAIRSIVNNQMSFVSSNAADQLGAMVELSAQSARNSTQNIESEFIDKKYITPVQGIRDVRLMNLSIEEMADNTSEILTSIEQSKPVQNLDGNVIVEVEERLIANSEGLWKREVGTRMKADILTTIKVGDFIGMGSSYLASRELVDDWRNLFNSAILTAYSQQNRDRISIGRPKGVILSPEATAKIMAFALIPSFNHTTGSQYTDAFRNFKFNKSIQLIDDPTFEGAQNTFGFDDEGYPSRPRVVVSGGKNRRLLGMNFLCAEPDQRGTYRGNCYRVNYMNLDTRSYSYYPAVSSSNFILRPKKSVNNLVGELTSGIYVKEITGAQDANYYSGDFVVSIVEGYEIKNGEIANPILPCFLSGNIYRILEDPTLLLGSELVEVPITATPLNVILPDILTSRMSISL